MQTITLNEFENSAHQIALKFGFDYSDVSITSHTTEQDKIIVTLILTDFKTVDATHKLSKEVRKFANKLIKLFYKSNKFGCDDLMIYFQECEAYLKDLHQKYQEQYKEPLLNYQSRIKYIWK